MCYSQGRIIVRDLGLLISWSRVSQNILECSNESNLIVGYMDVNREGEAAASKWFNMRKSQVWFLSFHVEKESMCWGKGKLLDTGKSKKKKKPNSSLECPAENAVMTIRRLEPNETYVRLLISRTDGKMLSFCCVGVAKLIAICCYSNRRLAQKWSFGCVLGWNSDKPSHDI